MASDEKAEVVDDDDGDDDDEVEIIEMDPADKAAKVLFLFARRTCDRRLTHGFAGDC